MTINKSGDRSSSPYSLNHIGLSVSNMEEALRFYEIVLQCQPSEIWDGYRKSYLDEEVGYVDCHIKAAYFDLPSGQVEILEYLSPKPERTDPETYNSGHMHLALSTPDIEADFVRLREANIGIEFRSDRVPMAPADDPDWPGSKAFYIRTPDGHTIEFAQH